jgi:hypothetical protein
MARGESGRTYSIWGFVAVFALMALAGVAALLVFGSSGGATVQVRTPQTLPGSPTTVDPADPSADEPLDPTASDPTTADPDAAAPTSTAPTSTGAPAASVPPAVPPSSAPAPADAPPAPAVVDVERTEGRTTFRFDLPPGTDPGSLDAVVAPMSLQLDPSGTTATLQIFCARAAGELLERVVVTDAADRVTVAAVALAPGGAASCPSGSSPRRVEIELPRPVAGRTVVVATVGSPVP